MVILFRVDELDIHMHLISRLLHAAFENIGHAESFCDFTHIIGRLLKRCVEEREITFRSSMLASRVRISSWMPTLK